MSIYDYRDRPAYRDTDWTHYTNRNIEKWWTPAHDQLIEEMIEEWQWHWYLEIADAAVAITPHDVIENFLKLDEWYNKIVKFAAWRAKILGLKGKIRQPKWKKCPLCQKEFIENSLPHPLVRRFGINGLDFCSPCLKKTVLQGTGNSKSSRQSVLNFIRDLTETLQRIPSQEFGGGIDDFRDMSYELRLAILSVLRRKPKTQRVKELFGSWLQALIEAGVLEDDALRTSRGTHCLANDGHRCFSFGEKTIDDYLSSHSILHEKEPKYPEGNCRADFEVDGVFIEYFGLQGNPEYDRKTKEKQELCKKHGIDMISIFPKYLISSKGLDRKFRRWIER